MKDSELGKAYADGEIVFKEGDKGETMYVVQSGNVKITKKSDSGEEVILATLTNGDIFGEMALFDRMPRSATAVSSGKATILRIDKKKLFTTISRDPTMVFKVLETMSQRIRTLNEELSRLKKTREHLLQSCCDVDETCEMILQEVKKNISAENGSVMLCDDDNTLNIKAAFGSKSAQLTKLKVGEGIAGDVFSTGRSEMLNNVSTDVRYKKGSTKILSMLCAPLKCDNKVFGVINMSNTSERLFVLEDLHMLNSLSVYASIAVRNSLNYAQLRVAADEVLKHASMLDAR